MARPKEFDPQTALTAAMEKFWESGFEATSLVDLTQCMGVQKASLYATYGDKRTLFVSALAQYQDYQTRREIERNAAADNAAEQESLREARTDSTGDWDNAWGSWTGTGGY